ncbi:hypothetical protein [Micromonospora sp. RV43]|uniref:hypothetical protein n=1 Tax=Micromonospora sp. RV43 TaxID=1661387 RepID=UPI00069D1D01|nr:hypothetical protein [Micromonospora sp. RV43]
MDFAVVSGRLADAGRKVPGVLRADPFVPDSVEPPHLYVGEWVINYDQSFGGLVDAEVLVRLLVSRADDRSGQARLQQFMRPAGPVSVKAAFEAEPTLGGQIHDLHVRRFQGHRLYRVGDVTFYGGEWPVRVIGFDSGEG